MVIGLVPADSRMGPCTEASFHSIVESLALAMIGGIAFYRLPNSDFDAGGVGSAVPMPMVDKIPRVFCKTE